MGNESNADRKEKLAHIVHDFDKKRSEQLCSEDRVLRNLRRLRAVKIVFAGLGAGAAVILFFYLGTFLLGKNPFIKKNYSWVIGFRETEDYRLQGCLFNMWQVRKAVDLYYAQYDEFPSDTDALYTEGFLAKKIVCPATHRRYIVKQGPEGDVFCCPNPSEHGVREIWADVAAGSPAIERE